MRKIARPLPFILAATNNATMIINHLDKHEPYQRGGVHTELDINF